MNRRQLFRNTLALAGASVVAPSVLTETLPGAAPAEGMLRVSDLVDVTATITPAPLLWPTCEELLAELVRNWELRYGVVVPATADYLMLARLADLLFYQSESARSLLGL